MANTSPKHRNKKLWTGGIILIALLLIISYVVSNSDKKIDPASFADVETFEDSAHIKGNPESGLVLIEYSDFQCPACKAAAPSLSALVDMYGEQVAIEYRHFPLRSIHPNAQIAAQASEAAAIQGKFWEMHDLLFENQSQWAESFNPERYFRNYAEEIGLNVDRFRYDIQSDEVKDRVNQDADESLELGLQGTPSFIYNGEQVEFNQFVLDNIDTTQVEVEVEAEVEEEVETETEA